MCIVCIPNNIIRNVHIYLNSRIFPTTGYARVLLFMFIRRGLGGTGTGCLFQFTYLDDRIKRSLTFLKSQNLYTMHWAMFVFCILCDAWTAICRFLLHSASQTYFACVILSIYTIYGLEKPYVMFKCQFQSKLG